MVSDGGGPHEPGASRRADGWSPPVHEHGRRANGHAGWTFNGTRVFEERAASFLAAGLAAGERLIFVSDDPDPDRLPSELVASGALLVLSTGEIYGPDRIVDSFVQRRTFERAAEDAVSMGYAGLRVTADNTSLIAGVRRLDAWVGWETEAEALMQRKRVTGLCAFDVARADAAALRVVMALHTFGPDDVVVEVGGGYPASSTARSRTAKR
ncbi:MAG TPA: MEDS domain-containing protein [Acidimicrobiales bacterium]|nr:MEDS domain-containing protein [Acidimicrobiales bacterium]